MIGSTCDYEFVVPEEGAPDGATLTGQGRDAGVRLSGLLGDSAVLEVTHISPGPSLLHSRLRLTPAGDVPPNISQFVPDPSLAFDVDRQVTRKLEPGDILTICRTLCGGLGISVVRDGRLVMAAGAVMDVPLGRDVRVTVPSDQLSGATEALKTLDPGFEWHEVPVAIVVGGETRVSFRGRFTMDGHAIYMINGPISGLPGTDACLAIARTDVCQPVAANTTALLSREWAKVTMGR